MSVVLRSRRYGEKTSVQHFLEAEPGRYITKILGHHGLVGARDRPELLDIAVEFDDGTRLAYLPTHAARNDIASFEFSEPNGFTGLAGTIHHDKFLWYWHSTCVSTLGTLDKQERTSDPFDDAETFEFQCPSKEDKLTGLIVSETDRGVSSLVFQYARCKSGQCPLPVALDYPKTTLAANAISATTTKTSPNTVYVNEPLPDDGERDIDPSEYRVWLYNLIMLLLLLFTLAGSLYVGLRAANPLLDESLPSPESRSSRHHGKSRHMRRAAINPVDVDHYS